MTRSEARASLLEIDVIEGLADLALAELGRVAAGVGAAPVDVVEADASRMLVRWAGPLDAVIDLRLAVAVSLVERVAVPRPKALLGDANLRAIGTALERALAVCGRPAYTGLRLGMAGRHTAVADRLHRELAAQVGLVPDDDGELFVRLRPSAAGWDVVVRLTPRPLSTRPWRVTGRRGALNACIAAAMVELSGPAADQRVLNACCGTGTLVVERAAAGAARVLLGLDHDADALDATRANASAAGVAPALLRADVTGLPLPDASVDVVLCDPPWGTAVGSHEDNADLYPRLFAEAARVLVRGGRFVVLSHEVRLVASTLADQPGTWHHEESRRVFQKGHRPRLDVLRRG